MSNLKFIGLLVGSVFMINLKIILLLIDSFMTVILWCKNIQYKNNSRLFINNILMALNLNLLQN